MSLVGMRLVGTMLATWQATIAASLPREPTLGSRLHKFNANAPAFNPRS